MVEWFLKRQVKSLAIAGGECLTVYESTWRLSVLVTSSQSLLETASNTY